MSKSPHGVQEFDRYYHDLFDDRWVDLRAALVGSSASAAFTGCLSRQYFLDPASVAVAHAVDVRPGQDVLDLCAAPGGKTLVLACALGETGRLVANERSSARRARLHRVLDDHLSPQSRALVSVTSHDASRWALHEPAAYDRVLADVPCSSERHVLNSAGDLAKWSPSRTKRLANAAFAIACAAVDAARPGAVVVYSTCALSPLENDGVIGRLLKRAGGSLSPWFMTQDTDTSRGGIQWERTEFGHLALPDRNNGAGPMYFARLRK